MQRPLPPSDYVPGGKAMTAEIGGRDRFKFFKRPVVPSMDGGAGATQMPLALAANRPTIQRALQPKSQLLQTTAQGSVVLTNPKPRTLEQLTAKKRSASNVNSSAHAAASAMDSGSATNINENGEETREMSCQTLMRENDCQTDPFTPDFFLEEGEPPEVLAIKDLTWGEGLPAKKGEIELIDRIQRRKNVEANLPQGNDNESMKKRLEELEKLERTEWDERESHIKNLQENRLTQIDGALRRREIKREEESAARVEQLKAKKLQEVEQSLQKMQEKRLVATRKLGTKHVNPAGDTNPRQIIEAHATFGTRSKPVNSSSLVEKVNTANYDVRPTLLSFPEGVQELEKAKVPKLEQIKEDKLHPPQEKAINSLPTNFQKRKAHTVVEHLDYAASVIEDRKQTKQKQVSVQDLYRATPRLHRPDTPRLNLVDDDQEDTEEAVLLLQRLLRGRAMQNDFFEGKERCHGLIEELQAASSAKDNEQWWLPEQEKEQFAKRQEQAVDAVVDEAQGDVIYGTLDYLFKELLRAQEAAKVDRLRQQAEATRAEREAAERARRAEEQDRRTREEAQYAAVVKAADAGVETYLDQLLLATVRRTAEAQAIAEQQRPKVAASEEGAAASAAATKPLTSELDREDYVCDLLDQFIIPTVTRTIEERTQNDERLKALAETSTWAVQQALGGQ